jgi:hypothetical protein
MNSPNSCAGVVGLVFVILFLVALAVFFLFLFVGPIGY